MIINNAGSRCDVAFWTKHLEIVEENERAELKQIRGLEATNLEDALLEIQREAADRPRLKNFMYHADFNPRAYERFTEKDWERSFEIFEKQRGIPKGTPRIVYEHEKEGRIHRHVIWARLDPETMRAFPDAHNDIVAQVAADKIVKEFGLEKVVRAIDFEPGTPRPPRGPKPWEMYRAMKTGIDPRDIAAEVTELYRQSENGHEFQTALKLHGYPLVIGRRGLLILDSAGKEHSLVKHIEGINTAELNAFMRDVDRAALPTVEKAKEQYQERKIAGLEADRATVRDEIQWHEALEKAAIAKEEKERRFVEPERAHAPAGPARQQQRQPEDIFAGIGTPITEAELKQLRQQVKRDNEREAQQTLKDRRQPEDIFAGIGTPITSAELARMKGAGPAPPPQAQQQPKEETRARREQATPTRREKPAPVMPTPLQPPASVKEFSRIVAKAKPAATLGKAALPVIAKALDAFADAAASLLAPTLTPQQIHEGDKAKDRREAQADFTIDFSRATAEAAQQRQQQESEREAARQRNRDEGRARD